VKREKALNLALMSDFFSFKYEAEKNRLCFLKTTGFYNIKLRLVKKI
jgi:hypothetical protein